MIIRPRTVTTLALAIAVACTNGSEHASPTDSAGVPHTIPATPSAAMPETDTAVTEHGLGPVRTGMTIAEAKTALGSALVVPAEYDSAGCDYAKWRAAPSGVRVMLDQGRIARIEVDSANVATAAGARVGDSEQRIQSLYAGRVTVTPHKYEDGKYLTVNTVGDSSLAIVFETSKGRVTRYRAGRRPAVEYVEGCS